MSEALDMTGVTDERIRRFVQDGKTMTEEEIDFFLDNPCFVLYLQAFPVDCIHTLAASPEVKKGLLTGVAVNTEVPRTGDVKLWVPAVHAMPLMAKVKEILNEAGRENPYEMLDFEGMDNACPGRDLVAAMLIGARDAGQDIS